MWTCTNYKGVLLLKAKYLQHNSIIDKKLSRIAILRSIGLKTNGPYLVSPLHYVVDHARRRFHNHRRETDMDKTRHET